VRGSIISGRGTFTNIKEFPDEFNLDSNSNRNFNESKIINLNNSFNKTQNFYYNTSNLSTKSKLIFIQKFNLF